MEVVGQPDWKLWILMEIASRAPAFEATEDDLQVLFDLVDNEINYGGIRRSRHGSVTAGERPVPP